MNYFTLLAQSSSSQLEPEEAAAATAAAAGIGIMMIVFWLVFMGLVITTFVFWIISLIHVLQHQDVKDRVMWIVILLIAGSISGIIYYFAVLRPYNQGGMREPSPPVNPS